MSPDSAWYCASALPRGVPQGLVGGLRQSNEPIPTIAGGGLSRARSSRVSLTHSGLVTTTATGGAPGFQSLLIAPQSSSRSHQGVVRVQVTLEAETEAAVSARKLRDVAPHMIRHLS